MRKRLFRAATAAGKAARALEQFADTSYSGSCQPGVPVGFFMFAMRRVRPVAGLEQVPV